MNQIVSNLASIKGNFHVSGPMLLAAGLEVAKIWLPQYVQQLNETQKALVVYGIIAAGNSAPKPPAPPAP